MKEAQKKPKLMGQCNICTYYRLQTHQIKHFVSKVWDILDKLKMNTQLLRKLFKTG